MASSVYNTEEVLLQDGTKVTLKPLVVAKQRRFMDEWEKMAEVKSEQESLSVFVACSGVGLEAQLKDKVTKDVKAEDGEKESETEERKQQVWRDYLENTLDMPTMHKILDVCGGLKLNDPNFQEAVNAAMERMQDQDGESSI